MEAMTTEAIEPVEVAYEDEQDPDVRLGWRITEDRSADWAFARVVEMKGEIASIEAQRDAAIERIEKRAASLIEKAQRGIAFMESRLTEYAETNKKVLLGGGKKKSRAYLHGVIGWREKAGRLVVADKNALVAWLETQPPELGLFRLKVEPEMDALQQHFAEKNVIPPGMEWEQPTDNLYLKPLIKALAKE